MRVAELLGSLSLATDLADGFSLEKCLRTAVLATRLAERVSNDGSLTRQVYWSSLLRFTGCTAFAHEEARDFSAGDDLSLRRTLALVDFGRPADFVGKALRGIAPAASLRERIQAVGTLLTTPSAPRSHAQAQCDAGIAFANVIGMPDVGHLLRYREERWDGNGPRNTAEGTELPLAARIADVADVAELFAWNFGFARALEELRARSAGSLDPAIVEIFLQNAAELFTELFTTSVWELFLATEPAPHLVATEEDAPPLSVHRCLVGFARFADLASVYTLGHAEQVALHAERATRALGLSRSEQQLARNAGLAHDLGRVAVPLGIWEKKGTLSPFERERVRTHSQQTETILRLAPSLAPIAELASLTHERGKGEGYHRRLPVNSLAILARVVAAADVYVALISERPHRPKRTSEEAERELRAMGKSGALDARAVDAVLDGSKSPSPKKANAPALTERELEVLRLVSIGRTNPEIGKLLGISPRTAQKHVMHIYDKLGVESRAGLALFAMEHGLL